jgi:hypothetical protein
MAISALCHDSLLRHFFTTLAGYPRDEDTITSNRVYAEIHVFHINDIEIHIVFRGDTATLVTYFKQSEKGEEGFDQPEIISILDKNADGAEWRSAKPFRDGETKYSLYFASKHGEWVERAEYDTTGDNTGILTIQTKAEYFLVRTTVGNQRRNLNPSKMPRHF